MASHVPLSAKVAIGLGQDEVRRNTVKYIGHNFGLVVHRKSIDVVIGKGSVIFAGAVVQAGSIIAAIVIINANVTIDHVALVFELSSKYIYWGQ